MSIPVGFTDIEELIRDLQLAGKIAPNNALTIRPIYTNSDITYNKLLNLIDPNIENNNQLVNKPNLNISLLPINFTQKLTTHHPYGWNDGAFSLSKGYQFLIGGGIYFQWHNQFRLLKDHIPLCICLGYNTPDFLFYISY